MDENFILEVATTLEEQAISFRHVSSQVFMRNEFVDCTLCCSDGQLQGHRLILASSSNYLNNMLSSTPCPTPCSHPMLFFKAFSVSDMKLAMEFIYMGSTKVSKSKLPVLMNIARELGCSSLSKAIEKAIHSCGVEIFRQRMQIHSHAAPSGAKSSKTASSSFPIVVGNEGRTLVTDSTKISSTNNESVNHTVPEPHETSHSSANNSPLSNSNSHNEERQFSSNEIKVESEECMMLELDPSSIVTTVESITPENGNAQKLSDKPVQFGILTNEGVGGTNNGSSQIEQVINSLIGSSVNNEVTDRSAAGEIGPSSAENGSHTSNIDTVDDEQDEDDEEMPITVVDLKSLAETDHAEQGEMSIATMSTVGLDISDALPSNCPWCFQIFTSLTLLQRHIKTHVGKYKPHSCPYCPASFARSAHLKRHIRTHTGEKPFTCTLCSRAFSRQDKLKTHLEKHLLEQQLQNNPALVSSSSLSFSSLSQANFGTPKPKVANVVKALSMSPASSTSQLSPHKEVIASSSQFIPSISPCPPTTSSYQYFMSDNAPPDAWQTQSERLNKAMSCGVPGQIPTSASIITPSSSATITPIPSFLVYNKNATSHL